jgi:hypothetical protein
MMLPRRLSLLIAKPGLLVGSHPELHAELCAAGQPWPLDDPPVTLATFGSAATTAIAPTSLPVGFPPKMKLEVRSLMTENFCRSAGLSGHPQHSPIS